MSTRVSGMVNSLIVGAARCGTTSLFRYLKQHPEYFGSKDKELHYFDAVRTASEEATARLKYHDNFDFEHRYRIWGEATPVYIYRTESLLRIWLYNPHMKLIVLFRDPGARSWSHWSLSRAQGLEKLNFLEAIKFERRRLRALLPTQDIHYSYLDASFYSSQIRAIRRYFPENQILFIKSETFYKHTQQEMRRVVQFLGLKAFTFDLTAKFNATVISEPKTRLVRSALKTIFRSEVRCVEDLLGWDCSDWVGAAPD